MAMGLPGITDNGVAGNLVTHRGCPQKEGFRSSSSIQAAYHLLPKWIANPEFFLVVLSTKSSAET